MGFMWSRGWDWDWGWVGIGKTTVLGRGGETGRRGWVQTRQRWTGLTKAALLFSPLPKTPFSTAARVGVGAGVRGPGKAGGLSAAPLRHRGPGCRLWPDSCRSADGQRERVGG